MKRFLKVFWPQIVSVTIVTLLILMLASCRSARVVTVPSEKRDSVYITRVDKDTTIVRDSIYTIVWKTKADTVVIERHNERVVYRSVLKTDTFIHERVDSFAIPYPVPAELTTWESVKVDYGGYGFMLAALCLFIIFRKFVV